MLDMNDINTNINLLEDSNHEIIQTEYKQSTSLTLKSYILQFEVIKPNRRHFPEKCLQIVLIQ